jgi:thiol-disulfide isomerase/thioredoxin
MKIFPRLAAGLLLFALSACKPQRQATPASVPPAAAAPRAAPSLGMAPAWHLLDLSGRPVSSDQFKGKTVVLDFWATWCGPCRQEIPGYVELQKKYAGDGLVFVGVSLDQGGPAVVKRFVDKYEVSYQMVMGDDKIQADYGGIEAYPTTFIIDRYGFIRERKVGSVPTAEFERRLLQFLKPSLERDVESPKPPVGP